MISDDVTVPVPGRKGGRGATGFSSANIFHTTRTCPFFVPRIVFRGNLFVYDASLQKEIRDGKKPRSRNRTVRTECTWRNILTIISLYPFFFFFSSPSTFSPAFSFFFFFYSPGRVWNVCWCGLWVMTIRRRVRVPRRCAALR